MAIIRESNRDSRRQWLATTRWSALSLLLAIACATTVTEDELNNICARGSCVASEVPLPDGGADIVNGSSGGGGGSIAVAGAAAGGSMPTGGMQGGGGSTAGGGSGGGGTGGGGAGASGAAGTAGTAGGGAGGTSGAGGGGGGAVGTSGAGAGGGGAAGTAGTAGTAGAGGATVCPAKTGWTPTASSYCGQAAACSDPNGPYPPTQATDASAATRFSSGVTQAGGEWIQIDLGASAALDGIGIVTTNADWTRAYEVRFAATDTNIAAAPVLAMGTGMMGTITANFPNTTTGRYLRITQTGAVTAPATNWWSVFDITIDCP